MAAETGSLFLFGALLLSTASGLMFLAGEGRKNKQFKDILKWGPKLAFLLLTLSILILAYYFLKPDFSLQYVFDRSSLDTPWIYRLSAMWAGQAGTFLLWAWSILLSGLYIAEKKNVEKRYLRQVAGLVLLGSAFFMGLGVMADPFQPTRLTENQRNVELYLEGKGFVDGMGLNPMLQSPYNALHPPLIFIGYGFVFVVFAASMVYLVQGKGEWEETGRIWARVSWIFITAAIAIGGLWAYEELAYGGYWTWDPIEAASLLPWLTLTAYLHGSIEFRRRKKLGAVTPIIGVLITLLIIYSTYITRSGIIKSSHSYGGSSTANYLIYLVLGITALTLFYARKRIRFTLPKLERLDVFTQSTMSTLSMVLLLTLAAVVFWGLTGPVTAKVFKGIDVSTAPEYYNRMGYLPAIALLYVAGVAGILGLFKKKGLQRISISVPVLSALFYAANFPTGEPLVNALIPIALFTSGGLVYRTIRGWSPKGSKRPFWKKFSSDLAHIGIVLIISGAVVSGVLSKSYESGFDFNRDLGRSVNLGEGFSVSLNDVKVYQDSSGNLVQDGYVTFIKGGGGSKNGVLRMLVDQRYGHLHTPYIARGLSDIYGVYLGVGHQGESVYVFFNFKTIPMVSFIWAGVILLLFGMTGVIFLNKSRVKARRTS